MLRNPIADSSIKFSEIKKEADIKFETLRSYDTDSLLEMDGSCMSGQDNSMNGHEDAKHPMHTMMVTPDMMGMLPGGSNRLGKAICFCFLSNRYCSFFIDLGSNEVPGSKSNGQSEHNLRSHGGGPKTWTQEDMDLALDALRNHNMSLTKVVL